MSILSCIGDAEARVFFYLDNVSAVKLSAVTTKAAVVLGNDSFFKKRYEEQDPSYIPGIVNSDVCFTELQRVAPNSRWKIACCLLSDGYFLDLITIKYYIPQMILRFTVAVKNDLANICLCSKIELAWECYIASSKETKAFEYMRYLRLQDKKFALQSELKDLNQIDDTIVAHQLFKKLVQEKDEILKYRYSHLVEDLSAAQKIGEDIKPIAERIRILISAHSHGESIWRDLEELNGNISEEHEWAKTHFVEHINQLGFIFQQNTWR